MKFKVHNTPPAKSPPEIMEMLLTALSDARKYNVNFLMIAYVTEEENGQMITTDCHMTQTATVENGEEAMDAVVKKAEDVLDGIYETGEV